MTTSDLETRLRAAGTVLDREIDTRITTTRPDRLLGTDPDEDVTSAPPLPFIAHSARQRRRRPRALAVAAAVAVLAGGAGAMALWRQAGGSPQATVGSTPGAGLPDGWSMLPPAPIEPRFQGLAVTTGTGLFVWGGYAGDHNLADGAFYDLATQTWQVLPEAPLAADRGDAIGVWTGREVVVLNGVDGVHAAAFDPASFTWRELPAPDLQVAANAMSRLSLLADGRVAYVGDASDGDPVEPRIQVRIFDPATDQWSAGADAPAGLETIGGIASTPNAIVALGGVNLGKSCITQAFAHLPATDSWGTFDLPVAGWNPAVVARAGDRILMAGGSDCSDDGQTPPSRTSRAMLLDPATGEWAPAADLPATDAETGRYEVPWTGTRSALTTTAGLPLFYDPIADTWTVGTALFAGGERFSDTPAVWLDGRLVLVSPGAVTDYGDGASGCCTPLAGGYAYTEPVAASGQ